MIYALAVAGVGLGILIIVAGWSADWRPYALLLAWAFIGCLYYLIIGRRPGAKAEPAVSLASE